MLCRRFAAGLFAVGLLASGPLPAGLARTAHARTNVAPTIVAPRDVNVFPNEDVYFYLELADIDGPAESLRVSLEDPASAPPGSFLHQNQEGEWVMYVIADPRLAPQGTSTPANVFTLRFRVDDGLGGVAYATTRASFLRPRGQNFPVVAAPTFLIVPAGTRNDFVVTATDPDIDPDVTLTATPGEPSSGVTAQVSRLAPGVFKVSATAPASAEGKTVALTLAATDSTGRPGSAQAFVHVPSKSAVDVVTYEVRWVEPQVGDPGLANFNPPENIETFEAPPSFTRLTDDTPQGDVEAYAIYASETPGFEPSADTLVGLADASSLNGTVTLTLPKAKGPNARHIRCTARRHSGESKPSKETSSDTPRFPGTPAFKKGKLTIPTAGSNIETGALVEVRAAGDRTDRFPISLHKKGTKWLVKGTAQSTLSDRQFKDVVAPGQAVVLVLVNANGRSSLPYPFVP